MLAVQEQELLVELWHGDDRAMGYAHPAIVYRLAELRHAETCEQVTAILYPDDTPGPPNQRIIDQGWELYPGRRVEEELRR